MTDSDPTDSDPTAPDGQLVQQIRARSVTIRERIAACTDREVRIVCVTKGHPVSVAMAAVAAGFQDLGENYAQELLAKAPSVAESAVLAGSDATLRWHFIGRLQSNKVRSLATTVHLWHTVDRASLAREIARRSPGSRVLVQLDLAGLEGRGGVAPTDAPLLVEQCRESGLVVEGLMGVGVPGPAELSRPGFRLLNAMADDLGLVERSMGMSADLEVAVSEGATIVRVGSALVGPRSQPGRISDG